MKHGPKSEEIFWARVVVRKWLNITTKDSDYGLDADDDDHLDSDSDSDTQEFSACSRESRFKVNKALQAQLDPHEFSACSRESRFKVNKALQAQLDPHDTNIPGLRRRKSEIFRDQYINSKEIRICVGTWNVGGELPPDDLDIDNWIDINNPADIYVLGLQEVVPLNACNVFGAEDSRPIKKWENIIRETLKRIRQKPKLKCFSDPSSPSKFKPFEDVADIEEEILLDSDSDIGEEEIHSLDEEGNFDIAKHTEAPVGRKLFRVLSVSERIGLCWPEPPLNLVSQPVLERPKLIESTKLITNDVSSGISILAGLDLDSVMKRRRRSSYVRILSKQMVGVFLTIWVRRGLRYHIQNVKVSTVGVGAMGYLGNKGSISVSMSIYQTLFCFVCAHLTSGEKEEDHLKRNAVVNEIHRRTLFRSVSAIGLPRNIYGHERIIWLGDLNYRLNLPYETTKELISKKRWSKLFEWDQLALELRKGRAFDGWSEGTINFAPTYKYEKNSGKYCGEDHRAGRRNPAWCDRIVSYGKGMKQLSYTRSELKLSDHRPVTAVYLAEVEVFCPRKLQHALTFTNAETENEDVLLTKI